MPAASTGPLRFGTDGVRGVANAELTPELTVALGRAIARVLRPPKARVLVGRDTRRSGPLLQAALSAGFAAEGVDVTDLGVLPTPGVAYLSSRGGIPAAMISASHNPFADNGIKVFAAGGAKLDTAAEAEIEAEWHRIFSGGGALAPVAQGRGVGTIAADPAASQTYVSHLAGCLSGRRLGGLSVVLDCANGAASAVAPVVFASLGAKVSLIYAEPDGVNINQACGSTHPASLGAAVVAEGADLGLAFDGDADRCLAVDESGSVVDGDHLMALFAVDLQTRGELDGNALAVTVMSNLGLRLAMQSSGIELVETPVGDRHVLDAMAARGLVLGGEQSGHIVFGQLATTGDGILTGALLADLACRRREPLSKLASASMTRLPQHLASVAVTPEALARLATSESLAAAVASVQVELGAGGRVVLRPSGTEPLVRVMVEAPTSARAVAVAERLCALVRSELGTSELGTSELGTSAPTVSCSS